MTRSWSRLWCSRPNRGLLNRSLTTSAFRVTQWRSQEMAPTHITGDLSCSRWQLSSTKNEYCSISQTNSINIAKDTDFYRWRHNLVFIILKKESHASCVTVATSRITSPMLGHLGTNFDEDTAISDQIETIATNRNSIATRASSEAYLWYAFFLWRFRLYQCQSFCPVYRHHLSSLIDP